MSKIRVFLADDHTILREGLKYLLKEEVGIEVVGEAADGDRLLKDVREASPDVVVVDISMPVLGGLEATQQLKKMLPRAKILILTMHTDEEYVHQAFASGASGYLVKKAAAHDLVSAIRAVHRGETYISPAVSERVVQEFVRSGRFSPKPDFPDKLTFRERQILKLIAEGWASGKIAQHLHISTRTVETHRANIMQKLKLHKVADLVKYAIRRGLVQVEP
jgi:DNA-binding NarL/FixJ family response regulator